MADTITIVSCVKYCYFYRGSQLYSTSNSVESGLLSGYPYTPSASSHMPSYDKSIYTSYKITYSGIDVTSGTIVCPSSTFIVYYYFYGPPLVSKWSWSASNGSATAAQTQAAYSAVTNQGKTSAFSYLVWNDMVDKAMEILNASGGSWNASFATYADTRMSASDRAMTAVRFNSLRYNIGLRYSTGITTRYQGDVIYGSYFITLANCLNGWIDNL